MPGCRNRARSCIRWNGFPTKLIEAGSFDIPGDALAPLWLELFVPAGTPGGVYRGVISIAATGSAPLELPVEVKVWNFELPRRNIVPTLVNVWERDLQTFVKEGDAEGFIDLLDRYCTMLLEHRLNPVVLAHAGWSRRGCARRSIPTTGSKTAKSLRIWRPSTG